MTDQDTEQTEAAQEEQPIFTFQGKNFKTKEEMGSFIQQLTVDKEKSESFAKGLKEATLMQMQKEEKPKDEEAFLKELEDEFFANPAKTLQKATIAARQEAMKEIEPIKQQLVADQQQRMWEKFYMSNKDLSGKEELVEAMVHKMSSDPNYKDLPIAEGLEKVAQKVRSLTKTERVMSNNTVQLAGSGLNTGARSDNSSPKAQNQGLDFVSQVRQTFKRKT